MVTAMFKFGQRVRVTKEGFYKNVIGNVVGRGGSLSGSLEYTIALAYDITVNFKETELEGTD